VKIAVFSDIHANLPALQRVIGDIETWQPDQVIMAGDLVNRGPRPVECLDLLLEKERSAGWQLVRGNHEDYVISHAEPDAPSSGPAFDVHRGSYWTYTKLNHDVSALTRLPFQVSLHDPAGGEARIVHASMRGNRDGIYPETTDRTLRLQLGAPPALLCVGHTHRPLIRWIGGTLVVNAGSAGLPFDGDRRAAYARLEWAAGNWRAEIVRLEYDFQAAQADFYSTGFIEGAGPLARLVLIELQEARSQLFQWAYRYQDAALDGRITLENSVAEFLSGPH
jgi:predicted phosphodiesterase